VRHGWCISLAVIEDVGLEGIETHTRIGEARVKVLLVLWEVAHYFLDSFFSSRLAVYVFVYHNQRRVYF
jgi:hypothetical protein